MKLQSFIHFLPPCVDCGAELTNTCADGKPRCSTCAQASDFCIHCGGVYESPTDAYQPFARAGVCRDCTEYEVDTRSSEGDA